MPDWISMKTPPKETGPYLCAIRHPGLATDYAVLAWAPWEDCRGWYVQDKNGNPKRYKGFPVTHWAFLTEPPPEDENDD